MSRIDQLESHIKSWLISHYVYTPLIGIGRSMLAMGTMLTLLTNNISYLMPQLNNGKLLNPLLDPMAPINRFNFFLLLGTEHVIYMKWLGIILLVLVILGYLPQVTSIFHWWISTSYVFFSAIIDGGDQIAAVLTFLLIPLCVTDPRRNHWNLSVEERLCPLNFVGLFSYGLIRLQVAIIYLHAATGKFVVTEWMNGTALYYWFSHSVFGMQTWLEYLTFPLLKNGFTVTILTYSVMIFELILFMALTMNQRVRTMIFPVAIAFHFSIILYHGIFSFFFSIGAGLVLYLLPLNYAYENKLSWVK